MPLLSVNAADTPSGLSPARDGVPEAALDRLSPGAMVTFMVHGYRFDPSDPARDPHRHILSLRPECTCWKAVSWPRHLHLDRPGAGLGIGYGWTSTGTLPRAAERARRVGTRLARSIAWLHARRPDLGVGIVAHSLGARVALAALAEAPPGAVTRLVLLSGAEYRGPAGAALDGPGAGAAHVLNVTSGENLPFDILFGLSVRPDRAFDMPVSMGLGREHRGIDLRIDNARHRVALAALGHSVRPPATRICHWSAYLRPGVFGVYRRFLDPGDPAFSGRLARALAGEREQISPLSAIAPAHREAQV